MKVVLLSSFYPRKNRDSCLRNSRVGLSAAADAHQYAIALGLRKHCDNLDIINLPAVFPYPHRNKLLFVKKEIIEENGLKIRDLWGFNLYGIQPFVRYYQAKKALGKIASSTKDVVYVIVYGTESYALRSATECRKEYSNIRICSVIADLPQYTDSLFVKLRNKIFFKPFEQYIHQFDTYVLLTKYMKDVVGCKDDNYIVSEGVYDETTTPRKKNKEENKAFVVLYTGMLHKQFGVLNLVNAIHQIQDKDIELHLCGYGNALGEINNMVQIDSRIKYLGVIPRDQALEEQSNASLLVNPRIPDNNPFTKYSFPSKTLEYLASGTPTLLYRLDGIPEEYYNYCYSLDSNNTQIQGLIEEIKRIKSLPPEENVELGRNAREFVLSQKNSDVMASRIIELLNNTK